MLLFYATYLWCRSAEKPVLKRVFFVLFFFSVFNASLILPDCDLENKGKKQLFWCSAYENQIYITQIVLRNVISIENTIEHGG